ncbi:Sensor histidine kinase LiaS [compost metagenome]
MSEKKPAINEVINDLFIARWPVLIWTSVVYISTVFLQFYHDPQILLSSLFTGLYTIHVLLHWYSYRFTNKRFWVYFFLQGVLIYWCAILMPGGYQALLIGLLPVLIAESLSSSIRIQRVSIVAIVSIIIFFDAGLTVGDRKEMIFLLPIFILMLIIMFAFAILFFRQVHERQRIQSFLHDLQDAHKKVEELTLANERQRMARDLHDTLAQGLAGLIMRLEAADAHLTQGNTARTGEIIKQSMQQARRTLADARRAIDNLRLKSAPEIDFKESVQDEVQHFTDATGIPVVANLKLTERLSRLLMEHSSYIVKECLTNIARHAKASKVWVTLSDEEGRLSIEIMDNGVGFNTDAIGKDAGHYGLLGLQERVRLVGGEMKMVSSPQGTTITVDTPLIKGESI